MHAYDRYSAVLYFAIPPAVTLLQRSSKLVTEASHALGRLSMSGTLQIESSYRLLCSPDVAILLTEATKARRLSGSSRSAGVTALTSACTARNVDASAWSELVGAATAQE